MAVRRHLFQNLVAVIKRGRHQVRRFIGRIAEHDALVARAFILVVTRINALRDMGGLAVQAVDELELLPMEAVLLIPDFLDRPAHSSLDLFLRARRPLPVFEHALAADFTSQNDQLRGCQRFTGNARFRVLGQEQIDNRIRNLIRDLVGMAFGNAFGREQVIGAHGSLDIKLSLCPTLARPAASGNQREHKKKCPPAKR